MHHARRLAELVHETLNASTISQRARDTAKLVLLDTVGVSLAAVEVPTGREIIAYVEELGGAPAAPVIGGGRVPAPAAALANGTLASALDFDEGFHIPTYVVPAALAVGADVAASGAAVLDAVVAGYEAAERLRQALDARRAQHQGLTYRGWYHVGIVGPLAAALTAGRLLGLGPDHLTHAVGMATAATGGLRANFGTMAKPYQAGSAASAGVQAAYLAARGFTADPGVLEGELGLEQASCREGESDWSRLTADGARAAALEGELSIKAYPACTPAHPPIAATLALREAHDIRPEQVAEIHCRPRDFSLRRPAAGDEAEAGFSLPYLVAVALVDGAVGPAQIRRERLLDPVVRDVMARVRPVPGDRGDQAPVVSIVLTDNRTVSTTEGPIPYLRSEGEVVAKFHACAAPVLGAEQAKRLRHNVQYLERLDDVGELLQDRRVAVR